MLINSQAILQNMVFLNFYIPFKAVYKLQFVIYQNVTAIYSRTVTSRPVHKLKNIYSLVHATQPCFTLESLVNMLKTLEKYNVTIVSFLLIFAIESNSLKNRQ